MEKCEKTRSVCLRAFTATLVLAVSVVLYFNSSKGMVITATIAFCVVLYRSVGVTGLNRKDERDYFDPGFLFVCFVLLGMLPAAIVAMAPVSDAAVKHWAFFEQQLASKVIIGHAILVMSFVATYNAIARKMPAAHGGYCHEVWISEVWIVVAASVSIVYFAMSLFPGGTHNAYIQLLFGGVRDIAVIFAVGVVLAKATSRKRARYLLILVGLSFLVIPNLIIAPDKTEPFISRGGAFVAVIGGAAYADRARWKGKLLNTKWIAACFLGALVALGGANIAEQAYLSGQVPEIGECIHTIFTSFATAVPRNAAHIVSLVDDRVVPFQYGANYGHALSNLMPFDRSHGGLAEWYALVFFPKYAEAGGRAAFSALGEGYLNWGMKGVVVHGIVLGISASLIRYFKSATILGPYGLFFYAASVRVIFYLYRTDTLSFAKKIEYILLETSIVLIIASLLLRVQRRRLRWTEAFGQP